MFQLLFCFSLLSIFRAQSITFLVLPSSEEVAEGSNATFECVARNGSQPVLVLWLLRRGQQQISSIVGSKSVEGTGGAIVGPNNGSPLTLTSVSRSLNGISVSCLAIINVIVQQEQPGPLATLNVTFPPSTPQMLNLSNISPFSVDVTWSTPSDIGSPPGPLTYTVTLTNITDSTLLQYTLPSTQITLYNLLPGVQYNVSVYAKNSVASGPPVTGVFRTNNSVPIVKQVAISTEQLRLFVNITMVTNGGLPISAYHISINGRTSTFPSTSEANQFGVRLELIGVLLRAGDTFPFSVQVENELGNSTQIDSSLVGINTPNMKTIAVPVLSAIVGLLGVLTLTAIVVAVIVGVCVCRNTNTKGVTEDSLAPPYESPVELKDVHKMKPQEQERGIQPSLQPNPSYEPLEVCESALEVKDAHKKNCEPEEQETSVDTKMQPNPSYEPLKVYEPNYL